MKVLESVKRITDNEERRTENVKRITDNEERRTENVKRITDNEELSSIVNPPRLTIQNPKSKIQNPDLDSHLRGNENADVSAIQNPKSKIQNPDLDSHLRGNENADVSAIQNPKSKIQNPDLDSHLRGNENADISAIQNPKSKIQKSHWRSLDQLQQTDEFKSYLHREFQEGASELTDAMSRRSFLGLMGASLALGFLAGCRRPLEKIVPYVKTPEETVIGTPEQYATSAVIAGSVAGLLVTTREGRPIKIEGNPRHPASLGGTTVFQQASILGLYDPDRSKKVLNRGVESDWVSFVQFWRDLSSTRFASSGTGLAVLFEGHSSPSAHYYQQQFANRFPNSSWEFFDPISDVNVAAGTAMATNNVEHPYYDFAKAEIILSLGSDFLMTEGETARQTRQFAEGRRLTDGRTEMNRLYVVESNFTVTGANADHRLRLKSGDIGAFAAGLAQGAAPTGLSSEGVKWFNALLSDLQKHKGRCVISAGRAQPPEVHALVARLNDAFGTLGETFTYRPPFAGEPTQGGFGSTVASMKAGLVKTLVIIGGNPAHNMPANYGFAEALSKVEHVISLSPYFDETARLAEWHINEAHSLECWGDSRAQDGTLSVQQPLIEPLFNGKSPIELLGFMATGVEQRGYDLVRKFWQNQIIPTGDFEKQWRKVLHDGVLEGSQGSRLDKNPRPLQPFAASIEPVIKDDGFEVVFEPSPALWDGRYANNGWLQELPDPMTKLTWDNAALISLATASKLGVATEDVIEITTASGRVEAPVYILPGHADNSVTLPLGYGRKNPGRIAEGAGFDAYPLRASDSMWICTGVRVEKTGRTYPLSSSQNHHSMEGRPIVREGTLEEYKHEPHFAAEMVEAGAAPSLWKEHKYDEGYQWGMTIDLNTCTGCNACAIACQSENNIPIVGKDQVARGREMHWIRLDRYFTGSEDNPQAVTQPVACQQCEMAPCEQVCPVAATNHDAEGLNVMTYNRCVGTRYCSNNCPYKVRRFNFFNYTNKLADLIQMAQNPDVTVRSRGVMEKCTYCVQRINRGKHDAKMENRDVRDGEIVTACQAACPAGAIVFGNINDPESKVSKLKKEERKYDLLAELNTRPRTSYLAKIRNPNPELAEG
jgi:molybdopterin-containing oxidoreductase family iron-sulfur binding subunit